jgi:N-succinyldiaminopimelate aminotransferase
MSVEVPVTSRLKPFGVSIFSEMSALALAHGAINLAQGFPDFPAPPLVKQAACDAIRSDHNQYAPSHGVRRLRQAIAAFYLRRYGLDYDPESQVTVFSGATEALHASILSLLEPGDEVVCFEPLYDSAELEAAFGPRTRMVLLNTPNNPSGKVFSAAELDRIGELCRRHDCILVSDEVYEHLTYDGREHVPPASRPELLQRTVTISSTAKTFSVTGWKIGYALAPAPLTQALRMEHQFVTFCSATPLQHAMAVALEQADDYYAALRQDYAARRELLVGTLAELGFEVLRPAGTYFALADIRGLGLGDDLAFCQHLVRQVGVAAVPASAFYARSAEGSHYARFSFCKQLETLRAAGERLRAWRGVNG